MYQTIQIISIKTDLFQSQHSTYKREKQGKEEGGRSQELLAEIRRIKGLGYPLVTTLQD